MTGNSCYFSPVGSSYVCYRKHGIQIFPGLFFALGNNENNWAKEAVDC